MIIQICFDIFSHLNQINSFSFGMFKHLKLFAFPSLFDFHDFLFILVFVISFITYFIYFLRIILQFHIEHLFQCNGFNIDCKVHPCFFYQFHPMSFINIRSLQSLNQWNTFFEINNLLSQFLKDHIISIYFVQPSPILIELISLTFESFRIQLTPHVLTPFLYFFLNNLVLFIQLIQLFVFLFNSNKLWETTDIQIE